MESSGERLSSRLFRWAAEDGTALVARLYGPDRPTRPVLCLPGLTRNSRDFAALATALSGGDRPRTVITPDYRGRGLSGRADPASYRPDVEARDILALLDALAVAAPAVVATSRGGIITMILAASAPDRVGPVVLNDIGPVIELDGLLAIRSRMQGSPDGERPGDWAGAAAELRSALQPSFAALCEEDWLRLARQLYREDGGRPVPDYDPALLDTFGSFDPAVGIPPFWPLFEALAPRPVLAIRGETSDPLSEATLAEMAARHPGLSIHRVPGQGHAPLLDDAPTVERIRGFLDTAHPA
jgi:pimeloyl-ACP methyl ester carboxylesterase